MTIFRVPQLHSGGDRYVRLLTFYTKFNSEQLLFEQFFYIIGNFGRVPLKSKFTFPFQYNIKYLKLLNLTSPLAPLLEEIDMRVR